MAQEGRDITYEINQQVALITLNLPDQFNALNHDQYLLLAKLVERANDDPNTVFTLIQSTGKYFSAGADVKSVSLLSPDQEKIDHIEETKYWLNNFTARNAYLTHVFYSHKKVLVCALNGPVIGLSSGLVALCDLIYSINDKDVFLLAPFANLGLVSEGAAAYTLLARLGLSVANEALLLSRPIQAKRLLSTGFINKDFGFKKGETDKFNAAVLKEIQDSSKTLTPESIFDIKDIIKSSYLKDLESVNSQEIIGGLYKWLKHIPQDKFRKISKRQMRHKL